MNFNTRSLKWIAGQSERHNVVSCQNRYKYVKESTSSSSRVSGSSLKWNKQTSLSVRPRSEFSNSGSNSLVPTRKNYPHIFSKVHRDGSCDRIHLCISNNSMTAASKRNNLYKYVRKDSSAIQSEVKESVNKPNSESPNTRAKSTSLHMAGSLSAKMHARNVDRFRYIKPGSSLLNPKLETLGGNSVNSKFLVKKMDQQSSSYSSRFHYKKIVRKAVRSLKFRRRPVCQIYCRTGKCPSVTCAFTHDENYLRICPKFLLRICPLGKDACPLAHVLDPCRLPQCSFYESGNCDRDQCPYLHVNYPPDTAVCSDFTMGRCSRGRLCNKRHVWLRKSVTNKSGRQKVFNVKITTKSNNANDEASVCSKPKVDNHSTLTTAPAGSLRNVFPAPEFIPLLSESDYLNAATDKSCL